VAATPGLTPYGLRHGYAWRGARYYDRPIPLRDLADLMGHDLRTHQKHYGNWTSDEDKRESVMRAVGSLIAG
jgi:integrase